MAGSGLVCLLKDAHGLLHHIRYLGEGGTVIYGHLCEHLPIKVNARFVKPGHELAVRNPVLSGRRIDTNDPETPKISFPGPPVAIGKLS
jgi:hypothetical protein